MTTLEDIQRKIEAYHLTKKNDRLHTEECMETNLISLHKSIKEYLSDNHPELTEHLKSKLQEVEEELRNDSFEI